MIKEIYSLEKIRDLIDGINDSSRKLIVSLNNSCYGRPGYYFFGLEGSPPRGWAVYDINDQTLTIKSRGSDVKKLKGVFLEGLKYGFGKNE